MTEDDKALVARLRSSIVGKLPNYIDDAADRIEALSAENERLQRSAEYWEQDAKRYAANQEHWRKEERAAIIAWLEKESTLCDCAAIYDGECVCGALDECKTVPIERILLAIEAGRHLK